MIEKSEVFGLHTHAPNYRVNFHFQMFLDKSEHCQMLIHVSITLLQVLETVRENLGKVLYDHMTNVVLNATQTDPSDNSAYFDDFLGDGDLDFFTNRTKVSHKVHV